MKLHEYHARQLLSEYGIPIPSGEVVFNSKAARTAFSRHASPNCVVKVQVLMGGRGKAGGVQKVKNPEEAGVFTDKFLGKLFSTYQSAGEGKIVKSILITEDKPIREEYYLAIVVDRAKNQPVILFSKEGGVEIEEVAAKNPSAIHKIHFSPNKLPSSEQILSSIQPLYSNSALPRQIVSITEKLAKLFLEKDASTCEINPLALVEGDRVLALDAKMVFDDNALFRHPEIQAMKDPEEEDERERKAKESGLSYVSMNGNVGCLVNGAGLAMATMDMIKLAGGEPANFLDVGGGATTAQVSEGFKIILQDPHVQAILVNIFGGIMKCDVIAEGVIQASREIKHQVPLVVRLEGTRVEEGRALLKNSNLSIISCQTIKEAAEMSVKKAKEYALAHAHSY
ncbi:MAG: succinate--CoA ligase subunit beta [Omnitrophica bacterium RIFCSPHIGHO2_02_FULL_51_18]|nr:MAG: succinate--CoA ligase subunit beta [Omnitrophica bacterium RIFCSPHIGHO2_02_FULL_51_18]